MFNLQTWFNKETQLQNKPLKDLSESTTYCTKYFQTSENILRLDSRVVFDSKIMENIGRKFSDYF